MSGYHRMNSTIRPSFSTRLMLLLLDGQPHELSEAWTWLVDAIPPQLAARAYHRDCRKELRLEEVVAEGCQKIIKASLWHLKENGTIEVAYPAPTERGTHSWGYLDAQQAVVQLTENGLQKLLTSRSGKWTRLCKELREALRQEKVVVSVCAKE